MSKKESITVALAGNPNCGKTTLFNVLTGARQRVGNWPGVTVERLEGSYRDGDREVRVIDLPGIYSFSAFSVDERISREYILREKPDVVINIVDATNLERNLYLTTQLLEMKAPVVVALNMMDLAKNRRIGIEVEHLSRHLDCPVIPMVASKREGLDELKKAILEIADSKRVSRTRVEYDEEVEEAVQAVEAKVKQTALEHEVDSRWLAVKLLENDELALEHAKGICDDLVASESQRIQKHTGDEIDIVIADGRYGFIHGLSRDVIERRDQVRKTVSDAIDRFILNRLLGIPIFLGVMYLVFMVTVNMGGPFIDFFDKLFGTIFVDGLGLLLTRVGLPAVAVTFLADGLGGGIQTVSTFVPPIFFIFLCLSFLEDSGYMARAAFVMDRLLRGIGLPGKAFLPMLVGFGCNVPAIAATRTLENRRDRIMTVMMNPFMSCGARLPVYAYFAVVFFPDNGSHVIFAIYAIGILLSILTGLLLKNTILQGEAATFVMELPPYHVPTFGGIMHHTWDKLKTFVWRAGRVIFVVVVILTLASSFGTNGKLVDNAGDSILGTAGKQVTPLLGPMGVDEQNWPAAVGLFAGVFAKEAVVGTLDTLYERVGNVEANGGDAASAEEFRFWQGIADAFLAIPRGFRKIKEQLRDPAGIQTAVEEANEEELETTSIIARQFGSRAAAFAYMLFILIYAPCVAAIAAIYRETSGKWAVFSVLYLTGLAWVVSTLFYQSSQLATHAAHSFMWIGICIGILGLFAALLRWFGNRAGRTI